MKGKEIEISLEKEQYEKVKKLAKQNGRNFNEQVNYMLEHTINAYLTHLEREKNK